MIAVQGGAEFGPSCRGMDAVLVQRAPSGPAVVCPLASAAGREYATAGRNGARHLAALGAGDVGVAPHPDTDPAGTVAAISSAGLLFLPGGSPRRIRDALVGTDLGRAVAAVDRRGGMVVGASAGAMVLAEHMVLPEGPQPALAGGLGLLPAVMVVPHWHGGNRWVELAPAGTIVLGLPECAGVLVTGDELVALGSTASGRRGVDGSWEVLEPAGLRR